MSSDVIFALHCITVDFTLISTFSNGTNCVWEHWIEVGFNLSWLIWVSSGSHVLFLSPDGGHKSTTVSYHNLDFILLKMVYQSQHLVNVWGFKNPNFTMIQFLNRAPYHRGNRVAPVAQHDRSVYFSQHGDEEWSLPVPEITAVLSPDLNYSNVSKINLGEAQNQLCVHGLWENVGIWVSNFKNVSEKSLGLAFMWIPVILFSWPHAGIPWSLQASQILCHQNQQRKSVHRTVQLCIVLHNCPILENEKSAKQSRAKLLSTTQGF